MKEIISEMHPYPFQSRLLFYCYDRKCEPQTILAEVDNTFGESRNHWLSPANELPAKNARCYRDRKTLHVSPFMPMELDYAFTFTPPGPRLIAHMRTLDGGRLEIVCPERVYEFGDGNSPLRATVAIHNDRFFSRALFGGDVGMGESYMDGDWSLPDLVSVIRLAVRNLSLIEAENKLLSAFSRALDIARHRLRDNAVTGSRRNIHAHYDLSNDFFRLFLDRSMLYSCAYYQSPEDSLETAQEQKLDRICSKLRLEPGDHVLEIGSGWGAFAAHAVKNYGCRVTTTTTSREQYNYAARKFSGLGYGPDRITLLLSDYRDLKGKFDK
jgi:cyclopropane-fatty-acyl-phospholipid synthase